MTDEEEIGDDLEQVEALQSKFDAYQRVSRGDHRREKGFTTYGN